MAQARNANIDPKADLDLSTIQEIIEKEEWNYLLNRLNSMQFLLSFSDRRAILESGAPDWIKCATFCCKTVPSS